MTVWLTEPLSDDSHGVFDQHFGFVNAAVDVLIPLAVLPARSVQAAACSMGLANMDHALAETNASNATYANFAGIGMTAAEGLDAMAEGLAWVGRDLDARVMRQSAIELRGGTPDFSFVDEAYRTLVDAPEITVALGEALRREVPVQQVSEEERIAKMKTLIEAIPDDVYRARLSSAAGGLPAGMWEMLSEIDARLFHRDHVGFGGVPGLKQGKTDLAGLHGGKPRFTDHGVMSLYTLDTSKGAFHHVTYRDKIVLRGVDGRVAATFPNPMDYPPGTPGSYFWKHDEAPDWRLEQTPNGRWAAAY